MVLDLRFRFFGFFVFIVDDNSICYRGCRKLLIFILVMVGGGFFWMEWFGYFGIGRFVVGDKGGLCLRVM